MPIEFVVGDIGKITWNPSSFESLAISPAQKKVITALAKSHVSRDSDDGFDDFVEGKGQGLVALLQCVTNRLDYRCWLTSDAVAHPESAKPSPRKASPNISRGRYTP